MGGERRKSYDTLERDLSTKWKCGRKRRGGESVRKLRVRHCFT